MYASPWYLTPPSLVLAFSKAGPFAYSALKLDVVALISWIMSEFTALDDILPADAAREGFVLHLLLDRRRVDFEDAAPGFDVRDGGDEPGQLVAGVEHLFQRRDARHAAVVGMPSR